MDKKQVTKLNNALFNNNLVKSVNAITNMFLNNGKMVIVLNNHITGKLTMFFNNVFGANGYDVKSI
jgi:hypothetical protein